MKTLIQSLLLLFITGLLPASAGQPRIVLDGTLGPLADLTGPVYSIGAEMGRINGGNLFHSFSVFGIDAGEFAVFTGPGTLSNIICRVTGQKSLSLSGSALTLTDAMLILPEGDGGRLQLTAVEDITISNGWIICNTYGPEIGAELSLYARNIRMNDLSRIYISSYDQGRAGSLSIQSAGLFLSGGSQIRMDAWSSGDLAEMNLEAGTFEMSGYGLDTNGLPVQSGISSRIGNMATGSGAALHIWAGFCFWTGRKFNYTPITAMVVS